MMRLPICRLRAEFQPQDVSPTSGRLPGFSNTTPLLSGSTFEWKTLVLQSRSDPRRQAKCLQSLLSKVHLRFRNWRLQGVCLRRMPRKLKPLRHWYALVRTLFAERNHFEIVPNRAKTAIGRPHQTSLGGTFSVSSFRSRNY